jgi:hypothetical protein
MSNEPGAETPPAFHIRTSLRRISQMQEADFRHLHVEFFMDAVEVPSESAKAGRPIFKDEEMIRIRIAGDKHSVLVAPAHSQSSIRDPNTNFRLSYAQLHSGPYEAFKKGVEFHGNGTPLSELPFLTESQRKELRALNIHTAEALASLDGTMLSRVGMQARPMKTQAEAYLERAAKSAGVSQLAAENEDLKARLARLEAMMAGNQAPLAMAPDPQVNKNSPFADWDGESIRTWLKENRGPTPGPNTSLGKLVKIADDHNASLKAEKEVA